MTLNEAVTKAEIILIEGERGAGKNTLASHFLTLLDSEDQTTALVTIPNEIYRKKQEIYKSMTNKSSYPYHNIFFLSDQWHEYKKKYGLRFLINDIEKIIDTTKAKTLYIQRIDELFDIADQTTSFEVISDIGRLALNRNVKLIVSVLKSSDNYTAIKDRLINYTDLTIAISSDNDRVGRTVQIISSFYPIASAYYQFVFSDHDFSLQEKNSSVPPMTSTVSANTHDEHLKMLQSKKTIQLVIISQQQHIINWSTYLLGNLARVSLKFFRNSSELSPEIWETCDLIVYSSDKMDDIFDFCNIARTENKSVKIFGWLTQGYIRTEDRVKAHQLGCQDTLSPTLRLADYILALEKSLSIPFYSATIDYKKQSVAVDSFSTFINLVEAALSIRRIFTIFIYQYSIPCKSDVLDNFFREEDVAYFDQESRTIYLLFMNAQENDQDIISQKLLRFKNDVVFEKAIEAPDLFSGKEVLKEKILLQTGS